jgi:hypothetical protein
MSDAKAEHIMPRIAYNISSAKEEIDTPNSEDWQDELYESHLN